MVKKLVHEPILLSIKSKPASKQDAAAAKDLLDTLIANRESCVGMAANMIGIHKRIIAFSDNGGYTVMYNPEITEKSGPYETEEGCLSLLGGPRKTLRYETVRVRFMDASFKQRTKTYSGFTAQIIQHETDHCNGILI